MSSSANGVHAAGKVVCIGVSGVETCGDAVAGARTVEAKPEEGTSRVCNKEVFVWSSAS